MRTYLLLNVSLLLGVAACELKITPDDTETAGESSGPATTGESASDGTTSGGSDATTGQSTMNGSTSVGTDPTTATSTTGVTTEATSSTTSATSATTVATSETTGAPVDPTPCEGDPKPIPGAAIAYFEWQVPPMPDTTGGSGGTGGDPVDPATIHVRLASQTFTCDDPNAALKCGPNWEVSFSLKPEFQVPGLYNLDGPNVFGVGMETGADEGGNMCSFGGGSFSATLEITDITAEAVVGRLCHINAVIPFNAAELEGSFSAPRCP